jgi:hypothetical protein
MTTNVKTVKRVLVSLNLPMKTASLVETATALVSPMTNPNFTALDPPLASVTAAVTDWREALRTLLEDTKAYVEARKMAPAAGGRRRPPAH